MKLYLTKNIIKFIIIFLSKIINHEYSNNPRGQICDYLSMAMGESPIRGL